MRVDPIPVDLHAEAGAGGGGDTAVFVDGVEGVAVIGVAAVLRGGRFGVDKPQFVVVGVAHRRHDVSLRRPCAVDLDIEAEAFGGVTDFDGAGDAHVVGGVDAHVVRRLGEDHIHLRLKGAHMLAHEDRRLDQLAQLAVGVEGKATVFERVFVPEEVGFVAGTAHGQSVGEGLVLAGRVEHEVHLGADHLAHLEDVVDLTLDRRVAPAVDLEGLVAHLLTLDGEFTEGFGGVEAAVLVAVIGGSIGGQRHAVAAQELPDRRVVELTGDVPEGDVDGSHAHAVVFAQGALDVVVDQFALQWVAPQQIVDEHLHLHIIATRAAHKLAGNAGVGVDLQDAACALEHSAFFVDGVEAVVVVVGREIGRLEGKLGHVDLGDDWGGGHWDLLGWGSFCVKLRIRRLGA